LPLKNAPAGVSKLQANIKKRNRSYEQGILMNIYSNIHKTIPVVSVFQQ
jgi:hypothetical protein